MTPSQSSPARPRCRRLPLRLVPLRPLLLLVLLPAPSLTLSPPLPPPHSPQPPPRLQPLPVLPLFSQHLVHSYASLCDRPACLNHQHIAGQHTQHTRSAQKPPAVKLWCRLHVTCIVYGAVVFSPCTGRQRYAQQPPRYALRTTRNTCKDSQPQKVSSRTQRMATLHAQPAGSTAGSSSHRRQCRYCCAVCPPSNLLLLRSLAGNVTVAVVAVGIAHQLPAPR